MDTKEAIEFKEIIGYFKNYIKAIESTGQPESKQYRMLKGVVSLLEKGEKYEKIVENMKNEQYDVWVSLPGYFTNLPEFVRKLEKKYLKEAKQKETN